MRPASLGSHGGPNMLGGQRSRHIVQIPNFVPLICGEGRDRGREEGMHLILAVAMSAPETSPGSMDSSRWFIWNTGGPMPSLPVILISPACAIRAISRVWGKGLRRTWERRRIPRQAFRLK